MDIKPLQDAFQNLLETAATVPGEATASDGGWNGDQILAHVTLVNAITVAAVADVTAGANTTYDNRISQDRWTIERVIARAGGTAGLLDRIRRQGEALCALGSVLSEEELDTQVPSLLLSNATLLVDQPLPLRDVIGGLAESELPGHTQQLLALRTAAELRS